MCGGLLQPWAMAASEAGQLVDAMRGSSSAHPATPQGGPWTKKPAGWTWEGSPQPRPPPSPCTARPLRLLPLRLGCPDPLCLSLPSRLSAYVRPAEMCTFVLKRLGGSRALQSVGSGTGAGIQIPDPPLLCDLGPVDWEGSGVSAVQPLCWSPMDELAPGLRVSVGGGVKLCTRRFWVRS